MPSVKYTYAERQRRAAALAAHVAEHGDRCQLCNRPSKTRGLNWDHDHRTGEHRGWLCHRCNQALPNWITPAWCIVAACYIGSGPAEAAIMRATVLEGRGQPTDGVL